MFQKAKASFGKVTQKVGGMVKSGFASHKTIENTQTAVQVAKSPVAAVTFGSLQAAINNTLLPADETDPVTLSREILQRASICCQLASASYQDSAERVLPPEAGNYISDESAEKIGKIPYFMTVNEDTKTIYVVCRGSFCFNDFITDAMANAVRVNNYLIHSGFFTAAHSVFIPLHDLLLQQAPGHQIIFTGHSLGAAVAALVADMFADENLELSSQISSVIFAPPSSVSRDRWAQTADRHLAFILGGDCVPFLTLHNIASLSSDIIPEFFRPIIQEAVSRNTGSKIDIEPPSASFNPFEAPPPPIFANQPPNDQDANDQDANDHKIDDQKPNDQCAYDQKVDDQNSGERETRTTTALYPEGRHYHLELGGEAIFKRVILKKIRGPEYFGRFILGMTEEHHQMSFYKEAIAQLLAQSQENPQ